MDWYKTLDIHKRINVKDCFKLLGGVDFVTLGSIFTFRERMEIFYNKLKTEGFDV